MNLQMRPEHQKLQISNEAIPQSHQNHSFESKIMKKNPKVSEAQWWDLVNIKVPFQIRKENLRRRVRRGHIKRAEPHGEIIKPLNESLHGQRHGRMRNQRVIFCRNIQRRPGKVRSFADSDATLPIDLRQPPNLLTKPLPRRLSIIIMIKKTKKKKNPWPNISIRRSK